MYCQNCGTKFNEDDRFCGSCGAARPGSEPVAEPTDQRSTAHVQPAPTDPTPPTPRSNPPVAPPATATATPPGRAFTIGAFACAAIAVFFFPPAFGAIGALLGWQGAKRGDSNGKVAMWTAIGGGVIGMVLSAMLAA